VQRAPRTSLVTVTGATGSQRIVCTGIAEADTDGTLPAVEHRLTEQLVGDPGIDTVVLRTSWYVGNFPAQLPRYRATGTVVGAAGEGRLTAASRADYPEAAAAALLAAGLDEDRAELGPLPRAGHGGRRAGLLTRTDRSCTTGVGPRLPGYASLP
jgi:NAD(P)H dehydrogenase (quinone)